MSETWATWRRAGGFACLLLLAALGAAAGETVWDRTIPDLDQAEGSVLDLASGELALAPRPVSFENVEAYEAALAALGDLAYEDADGGMLFVASGFALPLGGEVPTPEALHGLGERLEARKFLRGAELAPGAWFGLRARDGALVLVSVIARSGTAIRLAGSPPQPPMKAVPSKWVDAIAALGPASIEKVLLPALGSRPKSVLRVADGTLRTGPPVPEDFSVPDRAELVKAVGEVGDLAYLRPRAGQLVVASGKVAALGTGSVAKLAGRDLSERLRERPLVSSDALTPGSVMLIETRDGRYALLRVDAVEPEGLRISWLLQPDGSARFPDLAGFDASFEVPDPAALNALLLAAAARGDAAEIQRLLALGADPNDARGPDAQPPLVEAVIQGDTVSVSALLAAGADPAAVGKQGWNALQAAAKLGRADLARALLEAGVDARALTPDGQDALELALVSPRQSPELLQLLREQPGVTDTLPLAARLGDVAAIRSMLAAGARLDAEVVAGRSALEMAAAFGQSEALRVLLAAGGDTAVDARTGASLLLAAVVAGEAETAVIVLEHGGVGPAELSQALQYANRRRSPEIARALLNAGADAARAQGPGPSALEQALQYGDEALVDAYMEEGYSLSVAAAARLGHVEGLGELLEQGGDPGEASADGRTPLQFAIENDHPEALGVLLDYGASAEAPLPSWDQRTPLHVAAARADTPVIEVLLERGADPNQLDRVGRSPLYDAVTHGREQSVRALLEHGADPNLAPQGEALLEIARSESMRRLLASYGARAAGGELPD